MDCMVCGSCSYVCPSNIPLSQMFALGKGGLRRRKQRQKEEAEEKAERERVETAAGAGAAESPRSAADAGVGEKAGKTAVHA